MVQFKGVTVTIEVNGRPLPEYEDETSPDSNLGSVFSRFIVSSAGKAFNLRVQSKPSAFTYCNGFIGTYEVDGVTIDTFSLELGRFHDVVKTGPQGYVNGVWSLQQLHFADLKTGKIGTDHRWYCCHYY